MARETFEIYSLFSAWFLWVRNSELLLKGVPGLIDRERHAQIHVHIPLQIFSKSISGTQTCHCLSLISMKFTCVRRRANTAQLKRIPFALNEYKN